MPASKPSTPRIMLPSKANASAHNGCAGAIGANHKVTRNTPRPTAMPRTIAPTTYAANKSRGDRGGSSTKIRLPVILDWINEDELLANAFCNTDIITRPGIRNALYWNHPSTTEMCDSSTCEKISRYNRDVSTGAR